MEDANDNNNWLRKTTERASKYGMEIYNVKKYKIGFFLCAMSKRRFVISIPFRFLRCPGFIWMAARWSDPATFKIVFPNSTFDPNELTPK